MEDFLIWIIAGVIGMVIQYYIIKYAVFSALIKSEERKKIDDSVKNLLEIVAKGVGEPRALDHYLRTQKFKKKYNGLLYSKYKHKEKLEKIKLLKEEYADVLDEKMKK